MDYLIKCLLAMTPCYKWFILFMVRFRDTVRVWSHNLWVGFGRGHRNNTKGELYRQIHWEALILVITAPV